MKIGDSARVKKGIYAADYEDLPMDGWQGRVVDIEGDLLTIELDSITLQLLSEEYVVDSIENGFDFTQVSLELDELELATPRDTLEQTQAMQDEIEIKFSNDDVVVRVLDILKVADISVNKKSLQKYLNYLQTTLILPFQATGFENFEWEEPFLFGNKAKAEYEKMKLTKPSYTDVFEVLSLNTKVNDTMGIMANVRRVSDKKDFILPLWDLKVVDEDSLEAEVVSDYASWMTNFS
jgi:hypothetical protein